MIICVFFETLLVWARITPQINQKTSIIVMVSLRPTLSNVESDYNSLFFSENGYFLANFISPELLIVWNCATTHFKVMGWVGRGVGELVIIFKYSVLRTGSCLELCGQLDEEMFTFFIIYYRTINQKDNILYIELEKKHVFQFIYKDRNVKQL